VGGAVGRKYQRFMSRIVSLFCVAVFAMFLLCCKVSKKINTADKATDILWVNNVWRYLDAGKPDNAPISYNEQMPPDSNMIMVLIKGIRAGKYSAYRQLDDTAMRELSIDEFERAIDAVQPNGFKPQNITGLQIKESWTFRKSENFMVVRIVDIAPVVRVYQSDGEPVDTPLFWVNYVAVRNELLVHVIPANRYHKQEHWVDFFEGREFSSKIIRKVGSEMPY
jgi:hypothetical protein